MKFCFPRTHACPRWLVCSLFLSTLCGPAWAAGRTKTKPQSAATTAAEASTSAGDAAGTADTQSSEGNEGTRADGKKAKVLTFGAMDVEGKMRTPQLLFFLNRVKSELDSTTELRRSFMKELNATAKEKGL